MRQGRPAHPIMVLMSPDFGEPRIDQATPATSGGTNSGIRLAAATKPRHGVLVRTTIQENVSPIMTARAVPPVQAIGELASARCTLGLPRTGHTRGLAAPRRMVSPYAQARSSLRARNKQQKSRGEGRGDLRRDIS